MDFALFATKHSSSWVSQFEAVDDSGVEAAQKIFLVLFTSDSLISTSK